MEKDYWDKRYSQGGTSGGGSVGEIRDWKWKIITSFLPKINHVIDVGCGDLRFWEGRDCDDYIGIDVSPTVIEKNRLLRPKWKFICQNAFIPIPDLKKPNVFCIDLLYHVLNQSHFFNILDNLCAFSEDLLFVYTLTSNPFGPAMTDGVYQAFWKLGDYMDIFEDNGFKLLSLKKMIPTAGMYIFKRLFWTDQNIV